MRHRPRGTAADPSRDRSGPFRLRSAQSAADLAFSWPRCCTGTPSLLIGVRLSDVARMQVAAAVQHNHDRVVLERVGAVAAEDASRGGHSRDGIGAHGPIKAGRAPLAPSAAPSLEVQEELITDTGNHLEGTLRGVTEQAASCPARVDHCGTVRGHGVQGACLPSAKAARCGDSLEQALVRVGTDSEVPKAPPGLSFQFGPLPTVPKVPGARWGPCERRHCHHPAG